MSVLCKLTFVVLRGLPVRLGRQVHSAGAAAEQSAVNVLKQRLAANKQANLLVYECQANKSSVGLNLTGVVAAIFLVGTSYNSFLIFDSVKFKSQKFEDDGSVQSYIFKSAGN